MVKGVCSLINTEQPSWLIIKNQFAQDIARRCSGLVATAVSGDPRCQAAKVQWHCRSLGGRLIRFQLDIYTQIESAKSGMASRMID